jgi:hypothetical protein
MKHAEELSKTINHSFRFFKSEFIFIIWKICTWWRYTEQCGSCNEESQEALEQNYEEKLKMVEVQHQSQLSKISPCIIFTHACQISPGSQH